jgi:hypothetical protein
MSQQHRSISQRLKRAKSIESKMEAAQDWAANWQREQEGLIRDLEQAISNDDYDQLCIISGQLKAVSQKRFIALPKVISALLAV